MNGTILIALGIVGPIAIIVALIAINSKREAAKRKSELLETFNRIVAEQNLTISVRDILKHRILAMDMVRGTLIFVQNHGEVKYDLIQLAMIDDCKIKRLGTRITEEKKSGRSVSEEHINEISLSLISAGKQVIDIPVYSELQDGLLERMDLAGVAEKWRNIIHNALTES